MSRLRRGFRPRLSRWCLLVGIGFALLPGSVSAGPLDGVEETINNATAPAAATVEAVIPPATAPSSAGQDPAPLPEVPASPAPANVPSVNVPSVKIPPVRVQAPPPPPIKAPVPDQPNPSGGDIRSAPAVAKTAASAVESVVGATNGAGSTGVELDAGVEGTARSAAGTAQQAANAVIEPIENTLGTGSAAEGEPGSREASDGNSTGSPSAPAAAPVASTQPELLAGVPARLIDPFIHIWPAVALVAERSLDQYVADWSRSMLALFHDHGTRSLAGTAATLADPTSGSYSSTGQPPFSWLAQRATEPFEWVGSEKILVVLALFLVLATASLMILTLARREIGLPMLRRSNRFPWRR
jgi:hypothetical protein